MIEICCGRSKERTMFSIIACIADALVKKPAVARIICITVLVASRVSVLGRTEYQQIPFQVVIRCFVIYPFQNLDLVEIKMVYWI